MAAELPDDPTPRQVDAWIERADRVEDDGFRAQVRRIYFQLLAIANGYEPSPGAAAAFRWLAAALRAHVGG
ncbi:hypothetical protein [Streptomyces sp. NPDC048361]|uniref:hypothetical protein n=1 Tax=Streptomyces sp. NPDC048361 TaxID=3154720 RepID=UPI0034389ED8